MKNRLSLLLLSLVSLLASLSVLSCDSANPVAPTGSTLTVTANPTLIALNSTSLITVTGFRPDGNPLNPGTLINISTSIGSLDASVLEIQNGRATTTLRPDGRIGTATVSVSLATSGGSSGGGGEGGGGSGGSSASVDVQIGQPSDSLPTVTLTATPDILGLGESSELLVQAWNPDGTSYGAGGRVRLTTNLGSLEDEEVVTNASGEVKTQFHAGQTPGTATITGTIGVVGGGGGGEGQTSSASVDIQIGETDATRPTLSLSTSPSAINIETEATITAFARNADGSPLSGGSVVLVTNEGTFSKNNSITTTVTTGEDGRGTAILSGITSTATVTGSVGSSAEVTIEVSFLRSELTINANPTSIPLDGESRSEVLIIARDENSTLLGAGHKIEVFTSLGTIVKSGTDTSTDSALTNSSGRAEVDLLATGLEAGEATITAIIDSGDPVTTTVTFRGLVNSVVLEIPGQINRVAQTLTLRARALDAQNKGVPDVFVVFETIPSIGQFQTSSGTPTSSTVETDNQGDAIIHLELTQEELGASVTSITVQATIQTESGSVTAQEVITVLN